MTVEIKQSGTYEVVKHAGQWGVWSIDKGCFVVSLHQWTDGSAALEIPPAESEGQ